MALSEIPNWLDIHPRDFVSAMESGARAGEAAASLDQRAQESAAEIALKRQQLSQQASERDAQSGIQGQKLTADIAESAADRALKEKLSTQATRFDQNKFNLGMGLDMANLGIRQQNEARADRALKDKENAAVDKLKLNADKAVELHKFGAALKDATTDKDFSAILGDFGPLLATPGALAAWKGAYEKKIPKTSAASTPRKTIKTEIDPTTGGQVSRVETVTGPLGSTEETDHVAKPGERVKVTSQEQYDRLAPGTPYIDGNGKLATKPGKSQPPLSQEQQDAATGY